MRIRKSLGGGIRQGGFLAAAGLYALEHGHVYIQRDHANARILAEGINDLNVSELMKVDLSKVQTNLVFCESEKGRGFEICLLYTSPSPRDQRGSRMPSSA